LLRQSMNRNRTVEVYDPSFRSLLTVPKEAIQQLPNASLNISRLVLCRNYYVEGDCPKGRSCKFVHADVNHKDVKSTPIHVNYAWRSEELCTYPRQEAGTTVSVLLPNNRLPYELISSDRLLVTIGSTSAVRGEAPASHCAHYHFNRICNRGEKCHFIHALYVDPNAADLQKAPPPKQNNTDAAPVEEVATAVIPPTPVAEPPAAAAIVDEQPEEEEEEVPQHQNSCVTFKFRYDPYSMYTSKQVLPIS